MIEKIFENVLRCKLCCAWCYWLLKLKISLDLLRLFTCLIVIKNHCNQCNNYVRGLYCNYSSKFWAMWLASLYPFQFYYIIFNLADVVLVFEKKTLLLEKKARQWSNSRPQYDKMWKREKQWPDLRYKTIKNMKDYNRMQPPA